MTEQEIVKLTMIFQQLCDFEEEAHTGLDVIEDVAQWLAEQVADVDGQCQVRREPKANEPVPPSPFQAAVLEEALERIMTEPVDYICCGNYQPGNHPEDGPQCCGSPESTHEQIAAEALSRYRATPGQG